jgi:hypothetical protein
MRSAVVLLIVAACGGKSDEPPQPTAGSGSQRTGPNDKLTGSVEIAGKPATLRTCTPGRAVHTYVDIATSAGTLRFDNGELSLDGARLACDRLDRSWGAGARSDGTSYFRGKLDFACGTVIGKLDLECGGLTTAERLQLESNRQDMLSEKRADRAIEAGPFTTAIPDGWIDVAASGDPELGTLVKPGARALVSDRPPPGQRSVIVVQRIGANSKWTTCEELSRSLPPGIALTEPTLTSAAGDRTCTWKLTIARTTGRMTMRVHGEDAIVVQLLRGSDPDADADRAFDRIVQTVEVR